MRCCAMPRAALAELGAADKHVEVHIVESIVRTGAAAKEKLVDNAPAAH